MPAREQEEAQQQPQPTRRRWHLHRRAARHVGRGAHHVLRWIGAFAAVVILVAFFGIWRLMQGPIELDWLAPYVEACIQHTGVGVKVGFSGVRLGIDRGTHEVDLRVEDIRLSLPNGDPLARFPEMSTSFGIGALLHGQMTPSQVVVERPSVHLVRQENGSISAQIGGEQQETAAPAPEIGPQALEELAGPPEQDAPLGLLHRISVRGATLTVDDKASGHTWRADRVDIAIDRSSKGARGDVSFAVPLGNSLPELHASYRYFADRQVLDLDLSIDGVEPAAIPPLIPELAELRHVEAAVSGTLQTRIDLKRGIAQGSRLDLLLGKGVLHSDWLPTGSVAVEKGELKATYAPENQQVQIDSLALDLGGGTTLALGGTVGGVTPGLVSAPSSDARPQGELTGAFTAKLLHVPAARLGSLWPNGISPGGREWTEKNVHDGMLDEAALTVSLDLDPVAHTARMENAEGSLHYHGLTVDYVDGLPPARKVEGTARFAGRDLTFFPSGGGVKGLKLTGGTLKISDIGAKTEWLTVDLAAAGPLKDALEVIDAKPLHYAHDVGLDPEQVGGRTDAQVHFKLPLIAHLKLDDIEYGAKATMTGASIRAIALDRSLSDGNLALDVHQNGAQLQGTARFDEVPAKLDAQVAFHPKGGPRATVHVGMTLDDQAQRRLGFDIAPDRVSGPIAVDATYRALSANRGEATAQLDLRNATLLLPEAGWKKPPGQPGTATVVLDLENEKISRIRQITVAAPGLDGRMTAAFAADRRGLQNVAIEGLTVGDANIAGTVTALPGGGWQADIHAARVDMRHVLKDAASATPAPNAPPLRLNARIDRLVFGPQRELHQVTAQLVRTQGVWQAGAVTGSYANGRRMSLQFGADGGQRLTFESNDLGATLKLLDVADDVAGGSLRVDGQLSQAAGQRTLRAHIDGKNYVIARTPVMARLLALPSLTGFASTLSGSGLPFMSLRGDIVYGDGKVKLERLLAFGESLGITAAGSFDTDSEHVDLQGTVAPAYALNSLLGNFPIIGLLGGGSQGLLAANYRISGPSADPQVAVNPLSALAPGILRQLFAPFVGFTPAAAATTSGSGSSAGFGQQQQRPPFPPPLPAIQ